MVDSPDSVSLPIDALGKSFPLRPGNPLTIVVTSSVPRVRLIGMHFDTDKCFMLPSAIPGIRGVARQYQLHPDSNVLIVGHTDTSAQDEHNSKLSLERADAIAAYLADAVDVWEKFFDDDAKRTSLRCGLHEVQLMLSVVPDPTAPFFTDEADGIDGPITQAAVRAFQGSKSLPSTGKADAATRRALIQAYMAQDETTLPDGIRITTHGCGEFFPASQSADNQHIDEDRRVELFFFDGPITPAPPSNRSKRTSTEYPRWLGQVTETDDFTLGTNLVRLKLRLLDPDRSPRSNVEYVLSVGSDTFTSQTPADGTIDHLVDALATTGTLHVDGSEFALTFAALAPAQTPLGVQQRLNNLGYDAGPEDGQQSSQTQAALRAFQTDVGLPVTGQADASTIAALGSTYGS